MVYNHAVTGDPLKLPYMLHDEQYGHVRPFWFQSMKPQPAYRQPVIANAFRHDEVRYRQLHEWKGWAYRASQWRRTLEFFGPLPVIAPALVGLYALARSRRYRPLAIVLAVGFFCLNLTVFHFAHYAAPFAGLLAMLIVVGWRTLLAGSLLPPRPARAALAALAVFAVLSAASALRSSLQPPGTHYLNHFRHVMQQYLDQDIDQHLIFVTHPRELQEIDPTWIYNRANVDEAKVVWAADFGDGENQKLLGYYPARTAWRLDVADRTLTLQPYRAKPGQAALRFIEPGRRFSQKNQE